MPGCSPGVNPHCPVAERVFSTLPFQDSKFVGCSWALLPWPFPTRSCSPALIFLSIPLRACQGNSARPPHFSGIPLSIRFTPKHGGLVCAVLFGEGAREPLARAVTEPLFRSFRRAMLLAGLSFPRSRGSATLEFTGGFLWRGAPRFPAPAPRAQGARGGHGADLSVPEPSILVAVAPQGTGEFSTVPKKLLERAMGSSHH